jgi:hypothetical protein
VPETNEAPSLPAGPRSVSVLKESVSYLQATRTRPNDPGRGVVGLVSRCMYGAASREDSSSPGGGKASAGDPRQGREYSPLREKTREVLWQESARNERQPREPK